MGKTVKSAVIASTLALCFECAGASVHLAGRVVDEDEAAIAGVEVVLVSAAPAAGAPRQEAITGPAGEFAFDAAAPGDYLLTARREGYFQLQDRPIRLAEGANEVTLVLNPAREVFEKIDVSYSPPTIDYDRTTPEERLTATQVLEIPYPSTDTLRNVVRAVPGVVQDSAGDIHLNGGGEEQILYTLDGFEINDPLTGRFDTRMSVESVRSMDVAALNPAEFGKGSSGMLQIKTSTGDDRFRYSATDFVPGVENRKGLLVSGWTPRFNVSGPIRPGRAWFSDGLYIQYNDQVINELPKGQDRSPNWRVSNLLRNQFNLTPSNILYTGFLTSFFTAPYNGLGPLDPIQTTSKSRSRQEFFDLKDQISLHRGGLLEIGCGVNRTYDREIPQGQGLLIYTTEGRQGNSYLDATRHGGRDQLLANLFLPPFTLAGEHQVKLGADLDRVEYSQDATRTGYEYLTVNNTFARTVKFGGTGQLRLSDSEAAAYVEDSWKPRPGILIEAGLRQDWDHIFGNAVFSPRIGFAWAPRGLESTKISGGFGVVYDEATLQVFSRPLDQYELTTHYLPDGSVDYGPAASVFTLPHNRLETPRYTNWNLGWEQRFPAGLYARFQYTRRRGQYGLTYVNTIEPGSAPPPGILAAYPVAIFDAVYQLENLRRDAYDSFEITLRKNFRKQYEWLASYTRSRALSNSVINVTVDQPALFFQNTGPLPWDAPNRFLSWGYLPTFWQSWAIAYLLEVRNGFPFSIEDQTGLVAGQPDRFRFPAFFELNLHVERRFTFHGNHWAFRFGFNNITNHNNFNTVNNVIGSPQFLAMSGGQTRAFTARIRWLGKN